MGVRKVVHFFAIILLFLVTSAAQAKLFGESDHQRNIALRQQKAAQALAYLHHLTPPNPQAAHPAAIIFDIDETVLSNWQELARANFSYQPKAWDAWIEEAAAAPMPSTVKLLHEAQKAGYKIIFITGRKASQNAATIANLHHAGIDHWTLLIAKDPIEQRLPAGIYKAMHRHTLAKKYHIFMNVGDQASDFYDGDNGHVVKLPNPYYTIPSVGRPF